MEVSMLTSFNDLGIMNDHNFINQFQVNSLEEIFGTPTIPCYSNYNYNSTFGLAGANNNEGLINYKKRSTQTDTYHNNYDKLIKQLKTDDWSPYNHVLNYSQDDDNNSTILSFTNSSNGSNMGSGSSHFNPKEEIAVSNALPSYHDQIIISRISFERQSCIPEAPTRVEEKKISNKLGTSMAQPCKDHIIAERKRREKLSERFIALSAIIPGLKKMDKATVLGDAIKHVKQLQDRVQKLEEEARKKKMETSIYVKRSYVTIEDDEFSIDNNCSNGSYDNHQFPEIEAKLSDKNVLIRINCEKKQGIVEKIMEKIEELHLMVISSSSLGFGGSALALTIIAQMDAEFNMTAKDLVRNLHTTLK